MLDIFPTWAKDIIVGLGVFAITLFVALLIYRIGYDNGYEKRNNDFEQSFDFENEKHEQLK